MGGKQLGFSDYELTTAKKQTKREKFLSEMEVVVPWQALIELIEPHYPKASKKGGRPPYPLATMLRFISYSSGIHSATRRWTRP
jgi:IS5 family transposase